jgi:RES domain
MNGFTIVQPDGPLYRLARMPDPWAWPDWAYAGLDGTFGNRWDDPLGSYRVLYACTRRLGAFIETLARFRPDLSRAASWTSATPRTRLTMYSALVFRAAADRLRRNCRPPPAQGTVMAGFHADI